MEATIIVALIAALVSIASVIANIYIAKKSRQSAIEVLRAKATLEKLGNLDKNIKTVEIEAERLRICGHDLLAFLNRENNGAPDPDSHAEFSRLARRFANQAHG